MKKDNSYVVHVLRSTCRNNDNYASMRYISWIKIIKNIEECIMCIRKNVLCLWKYRWFQTCQKSECIDFIMCIRKKSASTIFAEKATSFNSMISGSNVIWPKYKYTMILLIFLLEIWLLWDVFYLLNCLKRTKYDF